MNDTLHLAVRPAHACRLFFGNIFRRGRGMGNAPQLLAFLLALALFEVLFLAADAVAAPVRVVYGFDREFAPFTYEKPGGEPTGFEIDLVNAIFNGSDATLVFRPLQWERVPLELSSGAITVTTSMVRTEQRSKLYLFSEQPTFPLQIRFFTKIYNRFPSASLLRGQMVSVEKGTYQHRLLEEFAGVNIKTFSNRVDGLRALYNEEVVAYCAPVQNTYFYIGKLNYGAITTVGTPLGMTEMRIAVNRDRGDIKKMVDDGLERVISSGEYDRLYRKWFVRELSDQEWDIMLAAAAKAAIPAYTPYGGNGQGAAVLAATGNVYSAASLENADFSLTLSALRAAVAKAVSEGEFELRAAVLVDQQGNIKPLAPEDLQTLYEFGRGILVLSEPEKGRYETSMLSRLLPTPVIRPSAVVKVE